MPLFEQSIPINRDEISKIVAQHWDIELGGIIKASQNHTFLATKKSNQDKVIVRVTPDPHKKNFERIQREIAYVSYLANEEKSTLQYVCGPIKSLSGEFIVKDGDVVIVVTEYARGEAINFLAPRWMTDRELIFQWGRWHAN